MSSIDDESGEMEALSEEKGRIDTDEKLATFKSRLELAKREKEIAEKEKNLAKAELERAEKEKNVFSAKDDLERASRQYKREDLKRRIKLLQKRLAKKGKIRSAAAVSSSAVPSAAAADHVQLPLQRGGQEEVRIAPIGRRDGGESTRFQNYSAPRRDSDTGKHEEIPLRLEDIRPLYTSSPKRGFGENNEKKRTAKHAKSGKMTNMKYHSKRSHEAGAVAAVCQICQVVYSTNSKNTVRHFKDYHR